MPRRLLLLACAIVFVDTMFFAAITPLLPHYADQYDLSKAAAGVLAAAYPVGTFVGAFPAAWLAGKIGVKQLVVVGLLLMAVSSIAFGLANSAALLDVTRFVEGLAGAASWGGALAWIVRAAPAERRAEVIGTAIGAALGGALLGPALGGAAVSLEPAPVFGAVGAIAIVLAVLAARMPSPSGHAVPDFGKLVPAMRDAHVLAGLWMIVLLGLCFGAMDVLVPLRLSALGAGGTAVAATFLLSAVGEMVSSPLAGRVSDRSGRLAPVFWGLPIGGLMLALLPLPEVAVVVALLVIVAGPAFGCLWAPGMALFSERASPLGVEEVLSFSLANVAWSLGALFGAGGGGGLASLTRDAVPYLLLAGLCAGTLVLVRRLAAATD